MAGGVARFVARLAARVRMDEGVQQAANRYRMGRVLVIGLCHVGLLGWALRHSVGQPPSGCKPGALRQRDSMRMLAVARPTRPPRS